MPKTHPNPYLRMQWSHCWGGLKWLLLAALVWLWLEPSVARAEGLLVLVSDRSAPVLVEGAHQWRERSASVKVQIRSVTQVEQMNDQELQALLSNSDSLGLLGVFGDSIERLLRADYGHVRRITVLHSDQRLLPLSRDEQGSYFTQAPPEALLTGRQEWASEAGLPAVQAQYPRFAQWLRLRAYWLNRSVNNAQSLLAGLASELAHANPVETVQPLRFALHRDEQARWLSAPELTAALDPRQPMVWLLDHDTADLGGEWQLHRDYCQQLQAQCVSVLAGWGGPSVQAVAAIKQQVQRQPRLASVIVSLQDFVIGGGEGRERVDQLLAALGVPVLKGVRLDKWQAADYALSAQGIPDDSVHYRIAMPELQGVSQPQVLALTAAQGVDELTGARLTQSAPQAESIARQSRRVARWLQLQVKANRDKHVAIVYYNHPPGRHNIGADNLNVPESLLEILRALQAQGYETGELPANAEALLDLLQARGINLPEDRAALQAMSQQVVSLSAEEYRRWFSTLKPSVQAEMEWGPLAALHAKLVESVAEIQPLEDLRQRQARVALLTQYTQKTMTDLHHALDGLRHTGRTRALDLLAQLQVEYQRQLQAVSDGSAPAWGPSETLRDALVEMQIEGIRGWGRAPGKVMVWDDKVLIPGLRFGNVFVGPQPPRGWEIHEELLHANMSFPPPHQYLGFYHYLQSVFNADAMIHVGRHSTYEFLPKRSVGLGEDDYPTLVGGDIPGIYPYIVDGVGEGIQAKRRGMAVMVDHLTPPLAATELYDDLLELRQLIESAEAASDGATRTTAITALRETIDRLGLRDALTASMDEELTVRGVSFDQTDDDFLLHETGHYLTNLQESFMPLGLHVFGRDWSSDAIETMLHSMADGQANATPDPLWRERLQSSPHAEMSALLAGLSGRFVVPGKGNDPIRTPDALPTGRNFYALDGSLLPTKVGYGIGAGLATQVLVGESLQVKGYEAQVKGSERQSRNKQGVILWASDAVRDEGAMIAFGMKLMGVEPEWNSRGILKGLRRVPLGADQPRRLDVVFTISGLFRDLYGAHLELLDKASLLALDGSADRIRRQYPALIPALEAALKPLGEWRQGGDESLEQNLVASNWVDDARWLLREQSSLSAEQVGRQASVRIFGDAPGAYGAGINRLVERSGAWEDRSQLADVFVKRIGHAYGVGLQGEANQALFQHQLAGVANTYLGRASNLYGLIDNNDAFDYLGGLNLAVETVSGSRPESAVIHHADASRVRMEPLHKALLSELHGRFLNPQWIKPLMNEGYSGARTMGSEFIEYLWGWQVTSPDIINDQVWESVKSVYIDDQQQLGLDQFLAQGHNRQVQTNMLAVMLVAIDKGFWHADAATVKQLANQFADNILAVGIPGSGHTHAHHPMYDLVKSQLTADKAAALEAVLAQARMTLETDAAQPSHIQELSLQSDATSQTDTAQSSMSGEAQSQPEEGAAQAWSNLRLWGVGGLLLLILLAGLWRGRRAL